MEFESVKSAILAIARGELVVVADDRERENEGDLIVAAGAATPEKVAFMVRNTSGILCVAARPSRLDALELPLMVPENSESQQTAFTVSVDYRHGTSTGVSSADRSATIRALADTATRPSDLARPGHVFPLRACDEGVLARPGHTEAATDLAELAGLAPVGALAEIVSPDGSMARRPELVRFARRHGLAYVTIAELVRYRSRLAEREALRALPMARLLQTPHRTATCSENHPVLEQ
jgi:3,4-dihydroxy-2-butanone 4-phosphate synthase